LASTQRLRALRDGVWKVRCEEHYAAGAVTRSISTWHHAEPDIAVLVVGSRNVPAVLHGGRVRLAGNPEPRLWVRHLASKRSEEARRLPMGDRALVNALVFGLESRSATRLSRLPRLWCGGMCVFHLSRPAAWSASAPLCRQRRCYTLGFS
jgi:hypothetical protein